MRRTLPIVLCSLALLALAACEGVGEPTQIPLPTIIFVQSATANPLSTPLLPPSPVLTATAPSPEGSVEPVAVPTLSTAAPSPTLSPTLVPAYTPTAIPTVIPTSTATPTSVPTDTPSPIPTVTSTPVRMCNIKVTNNIPCPITLTVADTEFSFEAGEERVIEVQPGTYSYVISGPCIMDLRDKGEFPAGYWSWSPGVE